MDFLMGGVAAVLAVFGYWTLIALWDWIDHRGARMIARRRPKP